MIILSCWDHSWGLKRKAIPHFKRILLHEWMDESRNINCKNKQSISSRETNHGPYDILSAPHARFWDDISLISKPSRYQHRSTMLMFWLSLVSSSVLFVCSRVKVWHCIGVDPQHLLSWSLPWWWVILLLFIESWTSLNKVVLMSLLAALVSSLPQGGAQGQGEDCGDELECLRQNIPGKRDIWRIWK